MKKLKMNKNVLYMITLILVAALSSIAAVYAERIIASKGVSYDNDYSELDSTNVQDAIDELYYRSLPGENFVSFLQSLKDSETVIKDDGTDGHNMRFIGSNPNNWVYFNGELWRIIGIFGTDSHGQLDKLIKIQYSSSIGVMVWSNNNLNDWSKSTLKTYLNEGEYYTKTLNSDVKKMIQTVKWKLGAAPWAQATMYADAFYKFERGDVGCKSNPSLLEWSGNVALAYQSDYIYSTNGGSKYARSDCLAKSTRTFDNSDNILWRTNGTVGECVTGSWILQQARTKNTHPWTLTSQSSNIALFAIGTNNNSGITFGPEMTETYRNVVPAVYLKSSVICKNCSYSGAGTQSKPYILAIEE